MVNMFVLHHLPDMDGHPAAERRFCRLHVPEVPRTRPLQQVSVRAVAAPAGADGYGASGLWHRDARGWRRSLLTDPPACTAPSWAAGATYPFPGSGSELVGTFPLERPADDGPRDARPFCL